MKVNCKNCKKQFNKQLYEIKKSNNHFCCRSCFISFNNKIRKIQDPNKIIRCECCNKDVVVSKFSRSKKCKICKTKKQCVCCGVEIIVIGKSLKKYCDNCRKIVLKTKGVESGKKSARSQQRRSKNEIYFSELCNNVFEKVLTNELFFEGESGKWDADIIIPEVKIAIMWNGIWHYKKIINKQSLRQIKNRDKIKKKVIENNGYYAYIIKDMGKFDKIFVEAQFKKFLKFLKALISPKKLGVD